MIPLARVDEEILADLASVAAISHESCWEPISF